MILSVLKIIGVILLIIIGLLIFILGLILFVPVRYQFQGSYQDTLEGNGTVRWFPILLNISADIKDNRLEYVVKIFGGVVMTNTDARLSWIGRKFFSFEEDEEVQDFQENSQRDENGKTFTEMKSESGVMVEEESFKEKAPVEETISGDKDMKQNTVAKESEGDDILKERKKRVSVLDRIRRWIEKLKRAWKDFLRRLKEINSKKDALLKVYHSKRFDMAKQDLKIYLKKIFSIIKPDKLEGYVHFGLEDPALTGQILGVLAMVLPLYQGFLTINPDFTKSCLDGTLKGKGKIFLFSIVKLAFKVILNKNLIKVTKKVQTILEA